eukprot:CAMPEP_0183595220 /NCGR_PEP_ID=MMETSP0371-20130417/173032_1 /TAXON_ID=268820 /ORGANISM="Peridinium aciculiferum, Strain PAER-2" /LENGTH=50 /DNA_ID=CAMNT_0025807003 /DNA_START=45 /DNA_END=194 /DNA_ORIENTATION=-
MPRLVAHVPRKSRHICRTPRLRMRVAKTHGVRAADANSAAPWKIVARQIE